MDGQRLGATLRAVRIQRGLRQLDVAGRAGVSDATVSRIERGHLGPITFETVEAVAAALEVRLDHRARTRGGELDRLMDARHASLGEWVIGFLAEHGWVIRPEASFSVYGERGSIDVLAWHPVSGALLAVELKTAIVDIGDLLSTLDRKRRLAPGVARSLGWQPDLVGVWLAIGDGATNRRRVASYAGALRAALPDDGNRLRRWLHEPVGPLAALSFVSDRHPGQLRSAFATPTRVPSRPARVARARPGRRRAARGASQG
ncbi:MAG TPA: helix-turn-helix transcriptional regulator [Candidatus Limnocylindrales bacterium]